MPPKHEASPETRAFHHIVENGSLGDLEVALRNGADVNAPGHIELTALMVALMAKDLEKAKLLLEHDADPELADEFNQTALRHAVQADFVDGVRTLLALGVDRGFEPRYPLKQISYESPLPDDPELEAMMRELGENPTVVPMIADVESVEVLELFLAAGDPLDLAPSEQKRAYVGLSTGGSFRASRADYERHKTPRYGTRNPERMDNAFWQDMVRIGEHAYSARQHYGDEVDFEGPPRAVWCFDRFGSTITPLGDGRFVQIAGEHEDYYDPDFHIYNDVVVHDGRGGFAIYGYPAEVFPPTDFHSATLVGDWIYIVGSLGYVEQRKHADGRTPVYRLALESWTIEEVPTSGDVPSRLHDHRARFEPATNTLQLEGGKLELPCGNDETEILPNEKRYELDLSSLQWRTLE